MEQTDKEKKMKKIAKNERKQKTNKEKKIILSCFINTR